MNVLSRGIRNAFRNVVRTASVVVILGLSIGLCLTMLIAHQAVNKKIEDVKRSVGNTVSIAPAGFSNFSQANNALTTSDLNDKVKTLAHVTNLTENLIGHLTTEGTTNRPGGVTTAGPDSSSTDTTSLKSPVKLNSTRAGNDDGPSLFIAGGGSLPANFAPPIEVLGTTDPSHINGNDVKIVSGQLIDGAKDSSDAMISADMASKNDLKIGSTFKAYGKTLTVAGIFDSGTKGGNNTVVVSLAALQRLSSQKDIITSATATVDSLDNLAATTNAVKSALGDKADVQSSQDQADNTVKPLENIASISSISLIGAIIAGAIIILLVMVMIVRERKREIGVLKAIGASNTRIIGQFIAEAVTFTLAAAVIGIIIGVAGGGPITNTLVSSASDQQNTMMENRGPASFGAGAKSSGGPVTSFQRPSGNFLGKGAGNVRNSLTNIKANVGWSIVLYGFGAAILIAVLGSTLASLFIAKIRPAEVLRTE